MLQLDRRTSWVDATTIWNGEQKSAESTVPIFRENQRGVAYIYVLAATDGDQNMKFFITIVFAFIVQAGISQYKKVPLTKAESTNGVLRHYQIADTYASADLYILLGKKFRFENYTCLANCYSEGTYRETENEIIFTSTLQKGTPPLQVEYHKRAPGDGLVKRIALLQDADGRVLNDCFVYINDDSTSCIFGDNLCTKELNSIDSIKVVLSGGLSSKWIKVNPNKEIIKIRILARGELEKYVIYNGRYRKDGAMLEPIFE